MTLNKVVDEVGSLLVFQLLISDSHFVQQFLPLRVYVATLYVAQVLRVREEKEECDMHQSKR